MRQVASFEELVSTPFGNGVNALCWPRTLTGDFAEVVARLAPGPGITPIDDGQLKALPLSSGGQIAVQALLDDLRMLRESGLDPVLDTVNGYLDHGETEPMRTDVCSFHADSATDEAATYLCTYHGASSEGLCIGEAIRRVEVPGMRRKLLALFGGTDDEQFEEWLNDHFYDLHYDTIPGAKPYSFGRFNLWRIAIEFPGCPVTPCVHRAPDPILGKPPRLLLLS